MSGTVPTPKQLEAQRAAKMELMKRRLKWAPLASAALVAVLAWGGALTGFAAIEDDQALLDQKVVELTEQADAAESELADARAVLAESATGVAPARAAADSALIERTVAALVDGTDEGLAKAWPEAAAALDGLGQPGVSELLIQPVSAIAGDYSYAGQYLPEGRKGDGRASGSATIIATIDPDGEIVSLQASRPGDEPASINEEEAEEGQG